MSRPATVTVAHLLRNPIHLLAFGFGAGLSPVAPGTVGTAVGIALYLPLQGLDTVWYLAITTVSFLLGVVWCARAATDLGVHDHPGIVWDEVTGFLITMTLAPDGWVWIALGFALFRLFDIAKPWPINWVDGRIGGGLGIMLDDVLAGVYAATVLELAYRISNSL